MFTAEQLDKLWEQMTHYEQSNFGQRYGDDYPQVAKLLVNNKKFLTMGGLM